MPESITQYIAGKITQLEYSSICIVGGPAVVAVERLMELRDGPLGRLETFKSSMENVIRGRVEALSGVGLSLQPSLGCLITCVFPLFMISNYRPAATKQAMPVSAKATPHMTATSMIVRAQSTLPSAAASSRFTLRKEIGSTPRSAPRRKWKSSIMLLASSLSCMRSKNNDLWEWNFKKRKDAHAVVLELMPLIK